MWWSSRRRMSLVSETAQAPSFSRHCRRGGSSMPPEARDPTDPREWMRRARSNLARARAGLPAPEVLYDDLAFDAQQAAEKAIKAVLIARQVDFPRTHSVVELLTLAHNSGVNVP